jgi:NADPH:quinone reductase-like Zn-dependent oxidoreductase
MADDRNDGPGDQAAKIPPPERGEVLVRIKAASLNYRDPPIGSGTYTMAFPEPCIPLSGGTGEVIALAPARSWPP